jgi:hypothetical protein
VGAAVAVLELLDADLGVNRSRLELLVAEELLDEADVHSAFQQVRGAGVAQELAAPGAGDVGSIDAATRSLNEMLGRSCAGNAQRRLGRLSSPRGSINEFDDRPQIQREGLSAEVARRLKRFKCST